MTFILEGYVPVENVPKFLEQLKFPGEMDQVLQETMVS